MHIGFRTSGGRGEYEVVGGHAGQSAASLEEWTFHFVWPDQIVRDTELWLDSGDSGKPRLRSLADVPFQIGRIVTSFLLLPEARRDMRNVAASFPIVRSKDYVVAKVGFGPETTFASPPDAVSAVPNYVEIANLAGSDFINVESRWRRLDHVLENSSAYSSDLQDQLEGFARFRDSGEPASPASVAIVNGVIRTLASVDLDYVEGDDPLPALERRLGITTDDEPTLPPPNELGEDEADVKLRSAQMYRLARVRDYSARRFSIDVREAYGHRCAFCGVRLSNIDGVISGIDAAHILAWGTYEIDVISNGIALCKNHHWAFDAALMVPVVADGVHKVRFTSLAERLDLDSIAMLGHDGMVIPDERLPGDLKLRPSPTYLARLYDDLVLAFED